MEQHGYTSTMSMILKRMLETDHNTRITCTELVQLLTEHMKSLQSGTYVEPTASLAYRKCDADDCTNAVKFECITCGGVSLCSKCFGDTHKFGIYKKHERTEIIIEKEEFVVKYYAKQLAHWIKESKNFVVFTGGGISVSAGVPDMRNRGIMKPYEFIICPTVTHMAIAELCRRGLIKHVISTNVDGLHIRSGVPSNMLSEMHGNGFLEVVRIALIVNNCSVENVTNNTIVITEAGKQIRIYTTETNPMKNYLIIKQHVLVIVVNHCSIRLSTLEKL
jgi:hypothetical protein